MPTTRLPVACAQAIMPIIKQFSLGVNGEIAALWRSGARARKSTLRTSQHRNLATMKDPTSSSFSTAAINYAPDYDYEVSVGYLSNNTDSNNKETPPPPKWSFYKRTLPNHLIALSSPRGRELFLQSLSSHNAQSYFPLSEQFLTQSEPAYCGLSTLVMVLNSLSVDPNVRWKSGWRWFDEDILLQGCCMDKNAIMESGIVMEQFEAMGRCSGAKIRTKRASPNHYTEHAFRDDVITTVRDTSQKTFLVTSFSRNALGQTGCGHFSPVAAYHPESDQVLIMDVARFKYPPYWVSLTELYQAMKCIDDTTGKNRGWFLVSPMVKEVKRIDDQRRPGESVNLVREKCPVGDIKITFCKARSYHEKTSHQT